MLWAWPHLRRLWAGVGTMIAGLTVTYVYNLWSRQAVPDLRMPSASCTIIGSGPVARCSRCWPDQLRTLDTGRELLRRFPISRNGWRLLGLGLRRNNAASFVAPYAPRHENEFPPSIAEAISKGIALDPAGHIIGYEVLAWEVNNFHSWFCSLSEKDVSQELAIAPGPEGLLESYDDAVRVAAAAVRPHDAAPFGSIDWYPWAVVNYPL